MTNKEKYKQAFSAIHIADEFSLEVRKMTHINRKKKFIQMVAGIACVLLVGGSTVAYATDLGGIQRTVQLWIHGDQTEVTIDFTGNGRYDMEYSDSDGNASHQSGGGVAFNPDGSERPLTEDEIMDYLDDPDVRYEDDGSVWIYYFDQKIDITNKFNDNVCYVQISNGDETLYMTIKYKNGWSSSPNKYPTPSSFN
ncbi:hypothetical protein [Sinanaerobacter sp. ZZT-01]|uniref:hypothetical protein n=1 Tax=Sinanaerobacter sp. ZZT-01 TaxID=3111540 RepID=UPI002D768207|nr:hypothetical protein [Sinanaerobacter sp. ZZT-01]WRR92973.1 hypothetical protein U5921_13160 [Sinanaerobacter sp. ZZT-01]